jgi:NDP-sugar pyrophosphorylase family protein
MTSPLATQAVILCGGKGTRLQGVIGERPKALAMVAGQPFLNWLLEDLTNQGIRRLIFCTGFGAAELERHIERWNPGIEIRFSRETEPLGTGGAIRRALRLMESDPVLVLNADSRSGYSVEEFLGYHTAKQSFASVLLARLQDRNRFGSVLVGHDGKIQEFLEKNSGSGPGWASAGVYLLSPEWIAEIPADRAVSVETQVFPNWIKKGLWAWPAARDFIDIGTPESLAEANRLWAAPGKVQASQ